MAKKCPTTVSYVTRRTFLQAAALATYEDLAANGGTPGQAGYGLMAWLVLHRGWFQWLGLEAPQ